MKDFDLKKYLVENKLTENSKIISEDKSWSDIDAEMDAEREAKREANEKYMASRAGRMLASELKNIARKPFTYGDILELLLDLNPTPGQFYAVANKLGLVPYAEGGGIGLDHKNYQDKGAMFNNFGGWGKG